MQINSVGLYSNRISYYGRKNQTPKKTNKNISSQGLRNKPVKYLAYPRRYLPEYYPSISTSKTYDSFTKLRDKNYLLETIKQKMAESKASDKSFSIAMFDMDNFKSVNELLGYKTGDDFIIQTSTEIASVAKENSLSAYRFGGEEFVIVFDENHTFEDRTRITDEVLKRISSNEFINSKSEEYIRNAYAKLNEHLATSSKVSNLIPLKTKRDFLRDLQFNFETKEARNDAYLQKCIKDVDFEIKQLYLKLISLRIDEEESEDTIDRLKNAKYKIMNDILLDKSEEASLDEYLLSVYDKTFEIHQIRKWIRDFSQNGGFSITGCVTDFNKKSLEDKTPIDVINEAGEILKQGKNIHKGRRYYGN